MPGRSGYGSLSRYDSGSSDEGRERRRERRRSPSGDRRRRSPSSDAGSSDAHRRRRSRSRSPPRRDDRWEPRPSPPPAHVAAAVAAVAARAAQVRRDGPPPSGPSPVKQGLCFAFLLKESCKWGKGCRQRHVSLHDPEARALRIGEGRGCITFRGMNDAISTASKELMLRLFDAWGDQMDHMIIGNIWNKLGQQLRDDGGREAWVVEHGEVLARLRLRTVEVLPEWAPPEWLGKV